MTQKSADPQKTSHPALRTELPQPPETVIQLSSVPYAWSRKKKFTSIFLLSVHHGIESFVELGVSL